MPIGEIPTETARAAKAAFPRDTLVMRFREEFADLFEDVDFRALYSRRGQPGLAPWRLALVTVLQFLEQLSDRQAADAVRARIDWKYALGLELTDPGFHFSVLSDFRARLVAGRAERLLLDKMLERFKHRGLVKVRGKQRTDSTHVLAAVHDLNLLEFVAETLRATLDDLAAVVPDWLRTISLPAWFERYGRRTEEYRLPKGQDKRETFALVVGEDGFLLLAALEGPDAPAAAGAGPMVQTLRAVWHVHYARDAGRLRWRSTSELPPVAERVQSPYDPEAHFSIKRQLHGDHGRCDVPVDAARHDEHGQHSRPACSQGPASCGALRGFRLCGRRAAGQQPAGPWPLARGTGPGCVEPTDARWARLQLAAFQD
jgi:transposase